MISEKVRRNYFNHTVNCFIPFLKENKISAISQINKTLVFRYQNDLLKAGKKPQSINNGYFGLRRIFDQLERNGLVKENPFREVKTLSVQSANIKERGCFEIGKLNGVFNDMWEDEVYYLLCLLVNGTGLRNSEISRLTPADLIRIDDCNFIDIKVSKTKNGVRIVPLHYFIYAKLQDYITKNCICENDYIFCKDTCKLDAGVFNRANIALGEKLNVSEEELKEQNITFYSGRHFYKTLLNSEELGADIEEIFMGHSVSKDVAKRYNHTDKQGKRKLLEKTRKVFSILDSKLFKDSGDSLF